MFFDSLPQLQRFGPEAVQATGAVCVVNAVVRLVFTLVCEAGKVLAYANKESIVVGGDLLMPSGQNLIVDSEHSAIFQCLITRTPLISREFGPHLLGWLFFGYSRAAQECLGRFGASNLEDVCRDYHRLRHAS